MFRFIKNSYKATHKFLADWWKEGKRDKEGRKKQKAQKPPGYWGRVVGISFFWLIMAFVFLLAVSSFGQDDTAESSGEEETVNEATLQPSVQFGEDFLYEYFTISSEEESQARADRLEPYLVADLEIEDNISLKTDNNNQDMNMEASEVDLHSIEETGENTATIIYSVVTNTEIINEEGTESGENGDSDNEENAESSNGRGDEKELLMGVPIVYAENQYAVYSDTKIAGEFENTTVNYDDSRNLSPYNGNEDAVNDFINTFFETYVEDSSERLVYMSGEDVEIPTLDGDFTLDEVEEVTLGVENNESENPDIQARVRVNVVDEIGVSYSNVYNLVVTQNDDRYEVISFEEGI